MKPNQLKPTYLFTPQEKDNFDYFNAAAHNYHIIDTMIKLLLSRSESFELAYNIIDSFLKSSVPYSTEISKHIDVILYEDECKESTTTNLEDN